MKAAFVNEPRTRCTASSPNAWNKIVPLAFAVLPGGILLRRRAGRGFPCSVALCAMHNERPALANAMTPCYARGKLEATLPFSFSLLEERRGGRC